MIFFSGEVGSRPSGSQERLRSDTAGLTDQPDYQAKDLNRDARDVAGTIGDNVIDRAFAEQPVQDADRLKEKVGDVRTYFGSKEQFEKAKGGRTHDRVILSYE